MKNKIINFILPLIIGILFINTFTGCNPSLKEAKNLIWKASKGQNTVYLVGTMHLAPSGYRLVCDRLNEIISESDGIAVEVNLIDKNNMDKLQQEYQKRSILEDGDIEKYLSHSEAEKLKSILKDYGIDYNKAKNYTPYGLLSAIEMKIPSMAKVSLNASGLDTALLYSFQKDGKIINELEGLDYQLDMMDKVYTFDTLKQYINEYHESSSKEAADEFRNIYDLYMNGDLKMLDLFSKQQGYLFSENNYNIMLKDRNAVMVQKVDGLADSGKLYVVAVGAGHFSGEDSIIKGLEKMGYYIEPIK